MGNNISPCFLARLSSAIHAPPLDPSKPRHLRIGLIGGDIPIFPPFAMALFSGVSLLGWHGTGNRLPYFPDISTSYGSETNTNMVAIRAGIAVVLLAWAAKKKNECKEALKKAETIANFGHVKAIAVTGPYAYSRNMMYVALVAVPMAGSIAFDTSWLGLAAATLWTYLHGSVVPAEEKFLQASSDQRKQTSIARKVA